MKYDDPLAEALRILACCCSDDFMKQLLAQLKAKDDKAKELTEMLKTAHDGLDIAVCLTNRYCPNPKLDEDKRRVDKIHRIRGEVARLAFPPEPPAKTA